MTKKVFAQPELTVVYVKRNDIITDSVPVNGSQANEAALAPMRGIFDPSDDWANAGY